MLFLSLNGVLEEYSHSQRSVNSERLPRHREDSWKHLIILDAVFFLSGRKMSFRRHFDFQDSSIQKLLKKKKSRYLCVREV